ncbi:hypothetical protein ABR157_001857 [Enterobacter soli]
MKRFEGSPAPWRINGVDYHDYGLIDAEGGEIMLLKAECERDDHNATLIAAAPDLLEALQQMVGRIEYYASLKETEQPNIEDWAYTYNSGDMDDARSAISKALGEE